MREGVWRESYIIHCLSSRWSVIRKRSCVFCPEAAEGREVICLVNKSVICTIFLRFGDNTVYFPTTLLIVVFHILLCGNGFIANTYII